jgi:chorismate synthase
MLESKGIYVGAHIQSVGEVEDVRFDNIHPSAEELTDPMWKAFPVIDDAAGEKMQQEILAAAEDQDSVGGVIECVIAGVEPGFGAHMTDGVENRLAVAMFGISAVKGIEFGSGFAGSRMRGSQNNDPFCIEDGMVRTVTNHHGGSLGGITSGMPIRFAVAVKPTPSISKPQQSVSLSKMEPETLAIKGRHDPCIVHRAVPVVAAVAAMTILDIVYDDQK